MTSIANMTKRLISLQNEGAADEMTRFHAISALVHEIAAEVRRLELLGVEKKEIVQDLSEAKKLLGNLAFFPAVSENQSEPEETFNTIEYLYAGINASPPDSASNRSWKVWASYLNSWQTSNRNRRSNQVVGLLAEMGDTKPELEKKELGLAGLYDISRA